MSLRVAGLSGGGGGGGGAAPDLLKTALRFVPGPQGAALRVANSEAVRVALKLMALLVLAALGAVVVLLLVNVPPRAMLPYSLGTEQAKATLLTFDTIVERFAAEHGARMLRWWQEGASEVERAAVLDAWTLRGREAGVHTATFVSNNRGRAVCGPGKRPSDAVPEGGLSCKDFPLEPVGAFYTYRGMAPLAVVVSCKRGAAGAAEPVRHLDGPDLPELRTAASNLLADLELWRDLSAFDPRGRPLTAADLPKLRSVENADLFLEALPLYVDSLRRENAIFRYADMEDAEQTLEDLRADVSGDCGVLGVRLQLQAEPRGARFEDLAGIVDGLERVFESKLAAAVRADRGALRELQWTRGVKDMTDEEVLRGLAARHPVKSDARARPATEAAAMWARAGEAARGALREGAAEGALAGLLDDGEAAFERAAALAELAGKNSGAGGAGWMDPARGMWSTLLDCLCPDPVGMRLAAECIADAALDLRAACPTATGRAQAAGESGVGAKYTSYINALNASNYARYYLRPARDMLNRLHQSGAMQANFWCAYFADITAAYITKDTGKPHLSELGNVRDTVSVKEYTRDFWKMGGKNGLKARTLDYTSKQLKIALMECSRSYAYAQRVIAEEISDDVSSDPVPAGAMLLTDPATGRALRWPAENGEELALVDLVDGDPSFFFVLRTTNRQGGPPVAGGGAAAQMETQVVSYDGRKVAVYDSKGTRAFVAARREPNRPRPSPESALELQVAGAAGDFSAKSYTIGRRLGARTVALGGVPALAAAMVCPTPGTYMVAAPARPEEAMMLVLKFSDAGTSARDVDYSSTEQEPPPLHLIRNGIAVLQTPSKAGPAAWAAGAGSRGAAAVSLAPLPGGGRAAFTARGPAFALLPTAGGGATWKELVATDRPSLLNGRGARGVTGWRFEKLS